MTPNPYQAPAHYCEPIIKPDSNSTKMLRTAGSLSAVMFGLLLLPFYWDLVAFLVGFSVFMRETIGLVLYAGTGVLGLGLLKFMEAGRQVPAFTGKFSSLLFVSLLVAYLPMVFVLMGLEIVLGSNIIDNWIGLVFIAVYSTAFVVAVLERIFGVLLRVVQILTWNGERA